MALDPRGNLKTDFSWGAEPNVKVVRNGGIVGTATLSVAYGIVDGKNILPMTPEEWQAVKERAIEWIAANPKPPAVAQ